MLKELPVKGDARKKVIDSLVRRGIREVDDITTMNCLADRIFGTLWNRIESSIRPDEQQEDVSASLMNWCQIQGARVIRLQNGDFRGPQRSNEIIMSQNYPTNAVASGIGDTPHIDNANAAFSTMEEAPIDPTNAVYPSMGNSSQTNTVGSQYPTMEGVAHIDPTNAVYPSIGNSSQTNTVGSQYPTMEGVAQIDPMNAIYPSMGNTPQIYHAHDREESSNFGRTRMPLIYT
ncbi:uncharacterized protein N7482_001585 [Penicillium canariense]|uniref:Uncharacterized protein n=1 Tax=Penicillium canariense TaxID=189055 RepID=A0A9W9IFE6_9EURO|nr:uncharacterized protein N7482_001585 [Penicillium canariense]KAJ5175708.1 hypothetical protein N7482_001585 [Penicillium canariense]